MNRTFLNACAVLAVALSMTFAGKTEAQNCNPSPGSGENVAWAWGANHSGQLGDGTTIDRNTPVQVQNLSGIQTISAGYRWGLALKNDGTVWAWGENDRGQLGDGTTVGRHTPVQVQSLSGVTAIGGADDRYSLALKNDCTVWAWGENTYGQLGDGTTIDRPTPVQVQNLSGIQTISAGGGGLALKNDGTVWAWGQNDAGQLGDGTTIDRHTPVQVQNLSGVTAIAAGYKHGLALMNDGTVWAWGQNHRGELGDGTTIGRHTPVQVQKLSGVTAIAAGPAFSLVALTDGTAWAWGWNQDGQLGDGTTIDRHTPVKVQNLSGIQTISAAGNHGLALKNDGTVWAWGANFRGQLGDGTTIFRHTPIQVASLAENLSSVTVISGGGWYSLIAGTPVTQLTVRKILVHPDHNHLRLFNLMIDGVVVGANINSGISGPHRVNPGNHTVSETGGRGTPLSAFGSVIGGDCAADGSVNLTLGNRKTCTITNYDNMGGCPVGSSCCEPGGGTQACLQCSSGCP